MEASTRPRLAHSLLGPPLFWALGLWCLQIAFGVGLPLFADEAYYWTWSRDLAAGYFDHPPAIAWWIAATGGAVRVTGLLLWPLVCWLLYDAGRRWGLAQSAWVPALLMATPLGFVAPILTTPDTPLLLGWVIALWGVSARRDGVIVLGLALGLWSKAAILVTWPGLALVLGWRRSAWVFGASLLLYSPHLVWSAAHDWLPWSFQAERVSAAGNFFEALAGQVVLVGPWVLWALYRVWTGASGPTLSVLKRLSGPTLILWLGLACVTRVEGNWPALAWPAAVLSIAASDGLRCASVVRWSAAVTLAVALGASLFLGHAELGVGPPRDGPRLATCLAETTVGPWVGRRYQETALLRAAGVPVGYRRAVNHRRSQFDRGEMEPTPLCGYTYLGTQEDLGQACAGEMETQDACGYVVTACTCRQETKKEPAGKPTGSSAKGGSRTPTP